MDCALSVADERFGHDRAVAVSVQGVVVHVCTNRVMRRFITPARRVHTGCVVRLLSHNRARHLFICSLMGLRWQTTTEASILFPNYVVFDKLS
jgi:hypothetical protein